MLGGWLSPIPPEASNGPGTRFVHHVGEPVDEALLAEGY